MATTMVKWFQHPMERFMDKVAIVSVSTYRDRYLDELESKRAAGFGVKSRGSTETQENKPHSSTKKVFKKTLN